MSRASEAYERLSNALIDIEPLCAGVDDFTVDTPTAASAELMRPLCEACPLFDLCRQYADLERPKVGYWAGKTYREYKPRQAVKS